jgi:hypothetical protein
MRKSQKYRSRMRPATIARTLYERKLNMRVTGLLCIFMIAAVSTSQATPIEMACESPRQEYAVAFDPGLRTFKAGDTHYRVLAIENTDELLVAMGHTVDDGPFFRAHFRPYMKIEFVTESALLFQTDGCRQ